MDVDGAYNAGLKRLYQLDATARHDLSGCRRDDIDMSESRPDECQAEERDDGRTDRATNRRRRRLDDLQRRGQKGTLVLFAAPRRAGNETIFFVAANAALADFMDATLQSVERRVTSTSTNQFVVSAILDEAPMVEREDAVGEANRR